MVANIFENLRKEKKTHFEKYFKKVLVIGNDYYIGKSYLNLLSQYESDQIEFISDQDIQQSNFQLKGPSSVRGKENIELYEVLFNQSESIQVESLFFKDLKFREFGKRSKSFKLLSGEDFYTLPTVKISDYPRLSDEEYSEIQGSVSTHNIIKIKHVLADDLVEQTHWEVTISNGKICMCEELIWGKSPLSFYEILDKDSSAIKPIGQFCDGLVPTSSLHISLEYKEKISDSDKTLLVPLSYTHDHGHFIGEVINEEGKGSKTEFVHFFQHTEINEEELSRKIRILKKAIDKVFELKQSTITSEFITISHSAFVEKFNDQLFHNTKEDLHLSFVGESGYIPKSKYELYGEKLSSCSYMIRGLLTI